LAGMWYRILNMPPLANSRHEKFAQ
jgi:hypothetical protein